MTALRQQLGWNGPSTYGHLTRLEALGCVMRHRVGGRIKWRYVGSIARAAKSDQRVLPPYRGEFRPLTDLDLFQHARLAMLTR